MTKITPTVGRKVWFWPQGEAAGSQPHDATIVLVLGDGTVNLRCSDEVGQSYTERAIQLVDPGLDSYIDFTRYATWMPYQIGQAKKDEDEKSLSAPPRPTSVAAEIAKSQAISAQAHAAEMAKAGQFKASGSGTSSGDGKAT